MTEQQFVTSIVIHLCSEKKKEVSQLIILISFIWIRICATKKLSCNLEILNWFQAPNIVAPTRKIVDQSTIYNIIKVITVARS